MTDTMLPILRQLHDADGDRDRADVLLRMPDSVVLKYHEVILAACRRSGFEVGMAFVELRVSLCLAVRGSDGLAPSDLSKTLDHYRDVMAEFAGGAAHG